MIALDYSGTTHHSASRNVTLNQPPSSRPTLSSTPRRRRPPQRRRPPGRRRLRDRTCSDRRVEEIPFVTTSSVLLVQAEERFVFSVVDLIRRSTAAYISRARIPCESGCSQAPRRQQGNNR
ncbi:hypothetical protein F511_30904 [Dorcoceras hygrometricum]|uniref:Uncharacterized protein n=1 Tax=Dorcoceras hygrometricum TaxID=472368 RepID=A0A2Z7B3S0_9LAMI|nr:hypothetical protein F511_30904 [Dorcoceras hygrometricum]